MGSLGYTKTTLVSAVADAGTVDVAYPTGINQAGLTGSTGGEVVVDQVAYDQGVGGATFSFGASAITITNDTGVTWPAGSELYASFGETTINGSYSLTYPKQVQDQVADHETRIGDLEAAP